MARKLIVGIARVFVVEEVFVVFVESGAVFAHDL